MSCRSGCQLTEKRSEFRWRPFSFFWRSLGLGQKNALIFGKNLFFSFILEIWRSLDFGQKNALIVGEDLFCFFCFGDHLILDRKTLRIFLNPIEMKIRVKFVYGWIKVQKKPPPLSEILATRLISLWKNHLTAFQQGMKIEKESFQTVSPIG